MSIKGYKFYIRPVTDPESEWVAVSNIPQEDPDYTFTDLQSGTEYEISARAVDMADNESEMAVPLDVSTPVHTPADDPMNAVDAAAIDSIVAYERAHGSGSALNAGCQVYITGPKGFYAKAVGTAYGRDLTMDDKMRYGSITKCATATLILAQIDAGHLSFDDTIDQFVDGVINGDKITMRHLLMMRSGIKDYLQQDTAIQINYALHPTQVFDPLPTIRSYNPPLHGVDEVTDYSNSNYFLLGKVLEKLDATYGSSRSARDIINQDFCQAVGMTESEWPTGVYMKAPYSRGWMDNPAWPTMVATVNSLPLAWLLGAIYWALVPALSGGWPAVANFEFTAADTGWANAAGAMGGTIADLVRFGEVLRDGDLISPAMKQLREEEFRTYIAYTPTHPSQGDGWSGAGLGVMKFQQWYGWIGNFCGYMSILFYNPTNGAIIAMQGNYYGFPVLNMFYKIRYQLWPESCITPPMTQRMLNGMSSDTDEFGGGLLLAYHTPGDLDGRDQLAHKVPFYL